MASRLLLCSESVSLFNLCNYFSMPRQTPPKKLGHFRVARASYSVLELLGSWGRERSLSAQTLQ